MYFKSEITKTYIEEHLSEKLDLKHLADTLNYSKFHFQRLFLYEMGVSPVNYVNSRRLLQSVHHLMMNNMTVTEISFEVGYSNLDTFIRRFKKRYGMTPTEYKNLWQNVNQEEKRSSMVYTDYYKSFSQSDKQNGIKHLERILNFSKQAHRSGLLSLAEIIEQKDTAFTKKAVSLLLEGTEPTKLRNILYNYIQSTELTSEAIFERILYLEGLLLIQRGEYPWEILKYLSAFFGEDFIEELDARFVNSAQKKLVLEGYLNIPTILSDTLLLEKTLKNIDSRSMQRLLRECDMILVVIAFLGTNQIIKEKVLKALSERQQSNFAALYELISTPNLSQIVDAQNEIIRIIQSLRVSQDII